MRWARALVVISIIVMVASPSRAADPFTLTATGGTRTVSVSSNDVSNLAGNLINNEDQFISLANTNVNGTLRYGSLNNAVLFTRNAAGTSASITIPSTGFSKTFTATNENDLQNQIEDFFRKNGAEAYARFLRSINEGTTLGVTDGNPLAVTALMADASFNRFGFLSPRFEMPQTPPLGRGFNAHVDGGFSDSDDGDGWYAGVGLGNTFTL